MRDNSERPESLALVVVNYGSSELIASNLAEEFGRHPDTGSGPFDVVIVDNYSSEDEARAISALAEYHHWNFVPMQRNLGFGAAVNIGIRRMGDQGASIFLVLNPDARIDRQTVAELQRESASDPMRLISPLIVRPNGSVAFRGSWLNTRNGRMVLAKDRPGGPNTGLAVGSADGTELLAVEPWLTGACLVIHRQLFDRVGGFDDRVFLYWEDVDLSIRARRVGGSLLVRTDLSAEHDEHGTSRGRDRSGRSATYFRYQNHSRLVFAAHHLDRRSLMRWIAGTPGAWWAVLRQESRRELLRSPDHLIASVRGVLSGLTVAIPALLARSRPEGASSGSGERLRILLSFPPSRPQGNPYRLLLEQSLRQLDELVIRNFTWREALTGKYQVFHVHWPEVLIGATGRTRRAIKQLFFALLLLRLRLAGIAVVSTMHNLRLPDGLTRTERMLLEAFYREVNLRIRLNTATEVAPDVPVRTVLHGHYRDYYGAKGLPDPVPGRVAFIGLVRRYKGVDQLIRAFRETERTAEGLSMSLRVRGRPSTPELASSLLDLASGDDRISLVLDFADEQELVAEIGEAQLIVLPYPDMHNSAAVLTALSLGRPVLVPDNQVNRDLALEVGEAWVLTYSGPLTGSALQTALSQVQTDGAQPGPDLSQRDWHPGAVSHARAYWDAYRLRREHGPAKVVKRTEVERT